MVRRTLALATVLVFSLAMGCTTTQKWMAGGAAAGAAVGGIWGSHAMGALSPGHAALVGAVTGATAGALVGDMLQEKDRKATAEELARLQEENSQLKSQLAAKDQELANANKRIADLEAELARLRDQLKNARIAALEINLATDILFRPGSARLSQAGKAELDKAAQTIMAQHRDKFIMIEGHTDAQPIQHSGWKSNWELGAARSLTVLHYLTDKGVDPALLSAATFSKYQPLASNDNADGRKQNRRAVIVVYTNWPHSQTAAAATPAK